MVNRIIHLGKTPTGPVYVGAGDIVAGATRWWGLRGYNAAYATGSNSAIDIVDQALGNTLVGVKILSTGALDVASIAAWVTAHSVTTIYVTKLYDQSGGGGHLTQTASTTLCPKLDISGATPFLDYVGGTGSQVLTNATGLGAIAQPFTISLVANRTINNNAYENYLLASDASHGVFGNNTADSILMYVGLSLPTAAATDGTTPHAMQCVFDNTGGSHAYIDGSDNSIALGGTSGWPTGAIFLGADGTRSTAAMRVREIGFWSSAFSGGNMTAMNSNQRGSNGWNF